MKTQIELYANRKWQEIKDQQLVSVCLAQCTSKSGELRSIKLDGLELIQVYGDHFGASRKRVVREKHTQFSKLSLHGRTTLPGHERGTLVTKVTSVEWQSENVKQRAVSEDVGLQSRSKY